MYGLSPAAHTVRELDSTTIAETLLPETLLHEAHHRIANNLAMIGGMIRLQAQSLVAAGAALSAADGRRMLLDAAARIDAVARHHRLLCDAANRDAAVSADYLKALCADAAAITGRDNVSLDCRIHLDEAALDQRLLPIGLIINELILNAVKYAKPRDQDVRIQVWCRSAPDGSILVDVEDDGAGLPAGFDPNHDGGFGFRIMRAFAAQVRGQLHFEASADGLRARLVTPPCA